MTKPRLPLEPRLLMILRRLHPKMFAAGYLFNFFYKRDYTRKHIQTVLNDCVRRGLLEKPTYGHYRWKNSG